MSSQHQFRSLPLRARKFQNRFCFQCGTRSTSQWRYSEDGSMLLCNACGIRSKKKPTISKRRSGRRHPKKFRERPTPPPSSNSEYMYQLMPCSPSQLWKECCRQGPNPFIPFDNPALSPNRCLDKGLIGNPILSLPTNIPSRLSSPFENKNTRIPQEAIIDSKGSTISGCYQTYDGKNTQGYNMDSKRFSHPISQPLFSPKNKFIGSSQDSTIDSRLSLLSITPENKLPRSSRASTMHSKRSSIPIFSLLN